MNYPIVLSVTSPTYALQVFAIFDNVVQVLIYKYEDGSYVQHKNDYFRNACDIETGRGKRGMTERQLITYANLLVRS